MGMRKLGMTKSLSMFGPSAFNPKLTLSKTRSEQPMAIRS